VTTSRTAHAAEGSRRITTRRTTARAVATGERKREMRPAD
jgi:hypothetical protein